MPASLEYRYIIDAFTPDTLPMERLAAYMRELALLLGEPNNVHFARIEKGSAVLVSRIDRTAAPNVAGRVRGLRDGTAPEDARKAFRQLDAMLASDNAVGRLSDAESAEVIDFPGRLGQGHRRLAPSVRKARWMGYWSASAAEQKKYERC